MLSMLTSLSFAPWGRLSLDELPQGAIALGGALSVILGGLLVVALLTYFKKWGWLWREWITTLDHKKIGIMYIIVALVMLLRGLGDAGLMRLQQALGSGGGGILDSGHFQQIFSAHGTIMIFFVAMGLMFGLINVVLPQMLGSRDVAFPYLNSLSLWLFVAGAALVNLSLLIGEFSAAGWLAYPPLSELQYSPGTGIDYWLWSLQIAGVGSLLSGINFLVTILKMRAPGMSLSKMPIFAWSVLTTTILIIFAFPILTVTLSLLALDRLLGMHFFTTDLGGNAMMYVNLIWAWGHPEVYILILPAFGIYSEVVATFSRKRLFGYKSMVGALFGITFLSFIVWLHHFFTMGAGADVNAFFGIMTMAIAIPTGVKVFNWLFTMYRGKIHFNSPMVWFMGFVLTFTMGGVAGVMMAIPAIDFQVHNSLFLVAHFHTMIVGGVVFGFMAGLNYWFPKIFGFKLHEGLGKAAAWCWIVGFVVAFAPLYVLGLMGATRRLDHYDASLGWQSLFIVAGLGLMIIGLGVVFQVLQLVVSIWKRKQYRDLTGDPWNGRTLEWATASPTPVYNFALIPHITDRDQFWANKQAGKLNKPKVFKDIYLPKNSPYAPLIGLFSVIAGFAIVWHVWWLMILGLIGIIYCIIARSNQTDTEYKINANQVASLEAARGKS